MLVLGSGRWSCSCSALSFSSVSSAKIWWILESGCQRRPYTHELKLARGVGTYPMTETYIGSDDDDDGYDGYDNDGGDDHDDGDGLSGWRARCGCMQRHR